MKTQLAAPIIALVWAATLYCWISNLVFSILTRRDYVPLLVFLVFLVLSCVLYLVEGMEIAFGDLRDKDAEQLQEANRPLLKSMQSRVSFFLSQRQVFAVSIISLISVVLTTVVDNFYVYGYGQIQSLTVAAIINFLFVNIFVLCVCQVAPKRLALLNSEKFLSQSRLAWRFVEIVGWLNLPAPSDYLVPALTKLFKYEKRHLGPSRSSHFNIAALLSGICVDQRSISIELHNDGSAMVVLQYLDLFLKGNRREITGRSRAGLPAKRYITDVRLLGAWTLSAVEDLRDHQPCLDAIFDACRQGKSAEQLCDEQKVRFVDLSKRFTLKISTQADPMQDPDWVIRFVDQLPEGLYKEADQHDLVCILYEARGQAPPGSFYLGRTDTWTERIASPCGKIYFSLSGASGVQTAIEGCDVFIDSPGSRLEDEGDRAERTLRSDAVVKYPVQGATYAIRFYAQ